MAYVIPTVTDFKTFFARDFPYGVTDADVMDSDIVRAEATAGFDFPDALFSTQANFTLGYLLLSAHWLVMNLQSSSQGIAGQYSWLQNSKSVGNVSEGLSIPQRVLDNPLWSMYSKTNYGAQFLQLVMPQLAGNMFVTAGTVLP